MAAFLAAKRALEKPIRAWVVGPTFSLTSELWGRLQRLLKEIHAKYPIIEHDSSRCIRLKNGSIIEKRSAHKPDSLRGGTVDLLICDEAAFFSREAWYVLYPVTVVRRAEVLLISTPFGRNWFWEEWLKGIPDTDGYREDYESWQFPSTVNPAFPKDELERQRESLPESVFRREYLAEFVDSGLEVFPTHLIQACTAGAPARPGKWHVAGIDLAKYQDWTVVVVVDDNGYVRDCVRFQQLDWGTQKERIAAVLKKWNAVGWIDSTGVGDPIYDDLRRAGLHVKPFRFTQQSKRQLVENLLVAMERGLVRFPPIPELIHELSIFQRSATKDGSVHYQAPAGQHDDCVMALALAVWGWTHTAPIEGLVAGQRFMM
jgi:hypothetical protein